MDLSGLLPVIAKAPSLHSLTKTLNVDQVDLTISVSEPAKAATIASIHQAGNEPTMVIVSRTSRAEELTEELTAWLGKLGTVHLFPERDSLPYERLAPNSDDVADRLRILKVLGVRKHTIIVTSVKALVQKTLSPTEFIEGSFTIEAGTRLDPESFLYRLTSLGYDLEHLVERPGQTSRRGGILDFYPPTEAMPTRIELVGEEVESLRLFDPVSQRSLHPIETVTIGPAREAFISPENARTLLNNLELANCPPNLRRRFEDELSHLNERRNFIDDYFYVPFLASSNLLDHLPTASLLVCDEIPDLKASVEDFAQEASKIRREMEARGDIPQGLPLPNLSWKELSAKLKNHRRQLALSRWPNSKESSATARMPFGPALSYGGQLQRLIGEVTLGLDCTHVIISQQAQRLSDLLAEESAEISVQTEVLEPPPHLTLVQGSLPGGWHLKDHGMDMTLLTDKELFGFIKQRRAQPKRKFPKRSFLTELCPGTYVVHVGHGIGRFVGLTAMKIEGRHREYLEIHYANEDRLFVPTDQLDRLSHYTGPSDQEPRLTRLGSGEWQRIKGRVRRAVEELAKDLVSLYAAREVLPGYPHSPDTPWQLELEASFPYIETSDQLAAIAAVKEDMERSRPMDRLVSGDVGYGKTEVAVRAAFKSVMDGKQVAILVPTTVLAQQHLNTFNQRLAAFAPRVEMLSRFRSEPEQKQVINQLASGGIDIVIGTHRLLQKDIHFKNLGLVIIDEEQRFGVSHKDHLKKMRQEVDVLTLSATPIPRTLYMALGGIRDMSTMETPPGERLPIKTHISEFDDTLLREAIVRELERGGQVYVVHNEVRSIDSMTKKIQKAVPEAIVATAHGQMPEQQLEKVMLKFVSGKIDVLTCTTIIESGLDIPNVNTIIINQADRLGLGQLYQLRGRVGRGAHRAYAYLFYNRMTRLTEAAQKRLEAIFEATELGAGLQIALRDLEIRGAGNLLGSKQSGNMAAVGLEVYSQLLAEESGRLRATLRGEEPPTPREETLISLDLPISAHIPESYISEVNLRLAVYKKLTEIEDDNESIDLERELTDRFGPTPDSVRNLLFLVRLRTLAIQSRVRSLATEDGDIFVRMQEGWRVPEQAFHNRPIRGLHVGQTLLRLEIDQREDSWQQPLTKVLTALANATPSH